MSSAEFSEWAAFYNLEPFGYEMDNWRAGMVASVIANSVRNSKKRRKPFQPSDFMPMEREPRKIDPRSVDHEAVRAKIDMAMVAWGGRKGKGQK